MSVQTRLDGNVSKSPYRSIVKDAYTTRDDKDDSDTTLEIVAWKVKEAAHDDDDEDAIKNPDGTLDYQAILDAALNEVGADSLSDRTALKSYADSRGGRAASTIRGYASNSDRLAGLKSSHPVKRVLRRFARSRDLGHFKDDKSQDDGPRKHEGEPGPIDMNALTRAYKLARSIASQNGFVFAPQSGDPVAVEDNERIDYDEIRRHDRPLDDTKAAVLLTKPSGKMYEYKVDLDSKSLDPADGTSIPPGGW